MNSVIFREGRGGIERKGSERWNGKEGNDEF
jgi:hypothetical protein